MCRTCTGINTFDRNQNFRLIKRNLGALLNHQRGNTHPIRLHMLTHHIVHASSGKLTNSVRDSPRPSLSDSPPPSQTRHVPITIKWCVISMRSMHAKTGLFLCFFLFVRFCVNSGFETILPLRHTFFNFIITRSLWYYHHFLASTSPNPIP
jgi:hypothetical protein